LLSLRFEQLSSYDCVRFIPKSMLIMATLKARKYLVVNSIKFITAAVGSSLLPWASNESIHQWNRYMGHGSHLGDDGSWDRSTNPLFQVSVLSNLILGPTVSGSSGFPFESTKCMRRVKIVRYEFKFDGRNLKWFTAS
jgi:hypothetical protein